MHRFGRQAVWMLVVVAACCVSARGWAQDAREAAAVEAVESEEAAAESEDSEVLERGRKVAVVALGAGASSGSVIETLLSLLDSRGFEVVSQVGVRRQMATALVRDPPRTVANQFVGLTSRIARGIEKFFYKGNQAALEILTPAFNLGMAHLDVLARRPDFASQV